MTTTTKIFVVLVCLFAFIFTPMAIQFTARTRNWRQLAEDLQDVAETALAHERSTLAVAAATIEHHRALRDQERERVEAGEQRIAELEEQIRQLTFERDELAQSRNSWEASARQLSGVLAVKTRHNEELLKAKEDALREQRQTNARLVGAEKRLQELTANLVIMAKTLKQSKEQIAAYRQENEELRRSAGLSPAATILDSAETPTARPIMAPTASPIRGHVVSVTGNLAEIDVGSASGVREGMTMVVLRDGDFVCDLAIETVRPNEAQGRIALTGGMRVRRGDAVQDETSVMRQ